LISRLKKKKEKNFSEKMVFELTFRWQEGSHHKDVSEEHFQKRTDKLMEVPQGRKRQPAWLNHRVMQGRGKKGKRQRGSQRGMQRSDHLGLKETQVLYF
jgi:hypothetical protein